MFLILSIITGILLFKAGIMDLKSKSISRIMIILLIIVCICSNFFKADFNAADMTGGFLMGLCAVGLSLISREQIGRGDGLVICALGLQLGFKGCLFTVCTASLIMAAVSIGVLISHRGNKNTRLPFIPSLFAGYIVCVVQKWG